MLASTAQLIAAYGGIVGGAGGVTAAVFSGLTWWRGRTRSAPRLELTSQPRAWRRFGGPATARDAITGDMTNEVRVTLANLGDAPAHDVRVVVAGGGAYFGGAEVGNPYPMIDKGESETFAVVVDEPPERVSVSVTWGQPPKVAKRRGPTTWRLLDLAPPDWHQPEA